MAKLRLRDLPPRQRAEAVKLQNEARDAAFLRGLDLAEPREQRQQKPDEADAEHLDERVLAAGPERVADHRPRERHDEQVEAVRAELEAVRKTGAKPDAAMCKIEAEQSAKTPW